MKSVRIFALLFVLGTLSISCEKCFECERNNYDSDGNSLGSVSSASICGHGNDIENEKASLVLAGYTCVQQ